MKRTTKMLPVLVGAALTFGLAACHEHTAGPGQTAGQKIDRGIDKLGEKMEDAGQKMQDKAHGD